MRKSIIYFLLGLMLVQQNSRLLVLTWFVYNQSYIAEQLCENRARPRLYCNGQCILAKRLKAAHERAKQPPARLLSLTEFLWYEVVAMPVFRFWKTASALHAWACPPYLRARYASPLTFFFHPPCCMAFRVV